MQTFGDRSGRALGGKGKQGFAVQWAGFTRDPSHLGIELQRAPKLASQLHAHLVHYAHKLVATKCGIEVKSTSQPGSRASSLALPPHAHNALQKWAHATQEGMALLLDYITQHLHYRSDPRGTLFGFHHNSFSSEFSG
eukprot:scaffold150063_cov17-Tisochrysis_lutea.AAC.1